MFQGETLEAVGRPSEIDYCVARGTGKISVFAFDLSKLKDRVKKNTLVVAVITHIVIFSITNLFKFDVFCLINHEFGRTSYVSFSFFRYCVLYVCRSGVSMFL